MNNTLLTDDVKKGVYVSEQWAKKKSGTLYRLGGDLFIVRRYANSIPFSHSGGHNLGTRESVTSFSPSASARMRRYLRECLPEYRYMVTLTYPAGYPSDGKTVKEQLRRFLQELRRKFFRDYGDAQELHYSCFWFLEFQARGAPHFHLFVTHQFPKDWISKRWYEIVDSEDIRHLHAGTRVESLRSGRGGTCSYAAKYANKQSQKSVPENYENVGRFWGVSGNRAVMSATTKVSFSDQECSKVSRLKKELDSLIKDAISKGHLKLLVSKDGVRVLKIVNKMLETKLWFKLAQINDLCTRPYAAWLFMEAELSGLYGDRMDEYSEYSASSDYAQSSI